MRKILPKRCALGLVSTRPKLGDDINIYVNFVPIYVIAPDRPSYCGGLWSEKGKQRDSQYYEDSEVVYSYYTNEDGTIRDNDIYNGVTQIPCPKTIKLHLERDSFNEYGGYTLAVSSPAMAALNNLDFSEIEKYWDELTAIMMISNPTYLGTIEEASSNLPLYDKSALLRKIKQAEIINNIGGTEKTIAVSDATFVKGKGYQSVLDVPAKKIYDDITAEIVLSDGAEVIGDADLGTYSVAGYLNDYLADPTKTELDALAQATLTYGAYADKFFNGSTDAELADVSAVTIDDVAQYKHNINVTEEGIDFVGAALTLESKTSVKLYFKVDEENLYDITDFAFTVNGNKAEPERNGDYYYITVPKLTAGELAKAQTFTVNDAEFSYSPFSYVYAALADSDAEKEADLINLVKALYLYGVEAGKIA